MGRYRQTNRNFEDLRVWQVGVQFPLNEYQVIEQASGENSIASTIVKYLMAGLDQTGEPPLPWQPAGEMQKPGKHMTIIRLTKSEYDKFIEYVDRRGETMSECVRRLIFGLPS